MTPADLRRAFEDHKDPVYDFALRMTASASVAEDVAQDCFVELLRNPGKFDASRGSLRVYLFGITRHLVHRHWRDAKHFVPQDDLFESELPSYIPDLSSATLASVVLEAVESLPALQREAVVLFEYEGCTLEEIAAISAADTGTIKSRLHRGRENLRRILAPLQTGVQK